MIPINLLLNPPGVVRNYPIREWRDVTLWLKWGIILSLVYVMTGVAMMKSPEDGSWIFQVIHFLEEYNDAITIPFVVKFGLFFIIESILIVIVWLIKSCMIIAGYQLIDAEFTETNIALSIAGASMVTGIWWLIPFGYVFMSLHSLLLMSYLLGQIHRLTLIQSILLAFFPAFVPYIV